MIEIVYICGYGRSGSTLLDRLLGSHLGGLSAGELTHLPGYLRAGRSCTCGTALSRCIVWGEVAQNARRQAYSRRVEAAFFVFMPKLILRSLARKTGFAEEWDMLGRSLRNVGVETVVDSSKTCWPNAARPLALQSIGLRVQPVFLWRRPDEAISSQLRARQRLAPSRAVSQRLLTLQALRLLASWVLANFLGLVVMRRLGGTTYLEYDEIKTAGAAIVKQSLLSANSNSRGHEVHMCSGNRMAFTALDVLPESTEPRELPRVLTGRLLTSVASWFGAIVAREKERGWQQKEQIWLRSP